MTSHRPNRQTSNIFFAMCATISLLLFMRIGSLLENRDGGVARSSSTNPSYTFVRSWGTRGSLPSQFESPWGLVVSLDQLRVYVIDQGNNRIQWFDRNGEYISSVGVGGFGAGSFNAPFSIAASDNHLFVSDMANNRIQDLDLDGRLIGLSGGFGSGLNDFHWPRGVEITKYGTLAVVDSNNDRIKVVRDDDVVSMWGEAGPRNDQFDTIWDIDSYEESVYITDLGADLVKQFTLDGAFIRAWGSGIDGSARLLDPTGIAVDHARQLVFVSDSGHNQVRVYTLNGNEVSTFGEYGGGLGQFNNPGGIDVAQDGTLYITDTGNNRIEVFHSTVEEHTPISTPTSVLTMTEIPTATYLPFNTPTGASSPTSLALVSTPTAAIGTQTNAPREIYFPLLTRYDILVDRTPTPTICPPIESEENDDTIQALNHPCLCEDITLRGSMGEDSNQMNEDDNDVFCLSIGECQNINVQIDLSFIDIENVDYDLYVILPDGSMLSSPHPRSATEQVRLRCVSGRYFVRVTRLGGESAIPYALKWSFTP